MSMFPFLMGSIIRITCIDMWNDMVDWATEVINYNSLQKGRLFIRYHDGYLIPRILGIKDELAVAFDGRRMEMTKEDIKTLSESGVITKQELEALLRGEEISIVINPK